MNARTLATVSLLALGTIAATPSPAPSVTPARAVSITCDQTLFYVWPPGNARPRRTSNDIARLGERFALVSGPRGTVDNLEFYELDVPVTEVGGGEHYWVVRTCANEI